MNWSLGSYAAYRGEAEVRSTTRRVVTDHIIFLCLVQPHVAEKFCCNAATIPCMPRFLDVLHFQPSVSGHEFSFSSI